MTIGFLHDLKSADQLFSALGLELNIAPYLIEKDYWIMHCLWGLKAQGYKFDLKGGTSLSKGFDIINRFSEDLDIQIYPSENQKVYTSKNHTKPAHVESRGAYFDALAKEINIPGISVERDYTFDDEKMRNAGIRLVYQSHFSVPSDIKRGVLLEAGFDNTTPNESRVITSWALDKISGNKKTEVIDNRALNIPCYYPEYTFIEKLQAILKKHKQQQAGNIKPINFLRHYYDIYCLLGLERVIKFIGTPEYFKHKENRFGSSFKEELSNNEALLLSDAKTRALYTQEYNNSSSLYYREQPAFEMILGRILDYLPKL